MRKVEQYFSRRVNIVAKVVFNRSDIEEKKRKWHLSLTAEHMELSRENLNPNDRIFSKINRKSCAIYLIMRFLNKSEISLYPIIRQYQS